MLNMCDTELAFLGLVIATVMVEMGSENGFGWPQITRTRNPDVEDWCRMIGCSTFPQHKWVTNKAEGDNEPFRENPLEGDAKPRFQ